jgi:hypothetical protein
MGAHPSKCVSFHFDVRAIQPSGTLANLRINLLPEKGPACRANLPNRMFDANSWERGLDPENSRVRLMRKLSRQISIDSLSLCSENAIR